jgi:hypothetical protein
LECSLKCLQDPITKPVAELDTKTLLDLLPEIPLWVKNPDYDRVLNNATLGSFVSIFALICVVHKTTGD